MTYASWLSELRIADPDVIIWTVLETARMESDETNVITLEADVILLSTWP